MGQAPTSPLLMRDCCHRRNYHPERARAATPLWLSFFASYFPIIPVCNVSDVPLFPSQNSPTPTSSPMLYLSFVPLWCPCYRCTMPTWRESYALVCALSVCP